MLMPALSKARMKARSITCINNLKTISLLETLYQDDHNGSIVWDSADGTKTPSGYRWCILLGPYVGDDTGASVIKKPFFCPVANNEAMSEGQRKTYTSYALNNNMLGMKVDSIKQPDALMQFIDSGRYAENGYFFSTSVPSYYRAYAGGTYEQDIRRHEGTINVAFTDGHAEAKNTNAVVNSAQSWGWGDDGAQVHHPYSFWSPYGTIDL